MSHAATSLHQLYLFFVNLEDGTIRVSFPVHANHEAVGQGGYLIIVADAGHRTSLRNDVLEVVQQTEQFFGAEPVGVLGFYAGNLVGDAPMHVFGRLFIDIPERVFDGILVNPNSGCQLVSLEVL